MRFRLLLMDRKCVGSLDPFCGRLLDRSNKVDDVPVGLLGQFPQTFVLFVPIGPVDKFHMMSIDIGTSGHRGGKVPMMRAVLTVVSILILRWDFAYVCIP